MGQAGIDLSIVIPVKDEAENISAVAAEINSVMDRQGRAWECIWVDDGSTDRSLEIIRGLCAAHPRHRFISFEKNFGKAAALMAAFEEAGGALIAMMDGDGQNDPADILPLADMIESGAADMVNGYRARRKDNLVRKISSRIGNAFRNRVTGTTVRDAGCGFRVFRRECVRSLPVFAGMHRFLPTLAVLKGFRLAEAPVNHRPRMSGKSKYSINNRLWVGLADTFGVLWLQKRAVTYRIAARSGEGPPASGGRRDP